MRVYTSLVSKTASAGDILKAMTKALGVKPCGGCNKRAEALNKVLTLVPKREKHD